MKTTVLIPTVGGEYNAERGCSVFEGRMDGVELQRFGDLHKGENVRAFVYVGSNGRPSYIWFTNTYCGPDSNFEDESSLKAYGKNGWVDYDEALDRGFVSSLKYRIEYREVEPPPS